MRLLVLADARGLLEQAELDLLAMPPKVCLALS